MNNDWIRCHFCGIFFRPNFIKSKGTSKSKSYRHVDCPRCGNGYDIKYRPGKKVRR